MKPAAEAATESAARDTAQEPIRSLASKGIVWGIAAGLAAAILFAGGAVVSRHLVSAGHSPSDLTLLRYLGCFPFAVVALAVMPAHLRLGVSWPQLLALLAVAGPPYHVLLLSGYAHATSGAGALLVTALVPVLGLAISWLMSGEHPRWQAVVGATLVLAGLVIFGGLATKASFTPAGLVIFIAAALAWAVLNHLVRIWSVDPLRLTLALALWAPLFMPLYLMSNPAGLSSLEPSADIILQFIYHGIIVAIGATLLFFAAIRNAGADRAAALLALVPPCAAAMGALFLGEAFTATEALGTSITICGIVLASAYAAGTRSGIRSAT